MKNLTKIFAHSFGVSTNISRNVGEKVTTEVGEKYFKISQELLIPKKEK